MGLDTVEIILWAEEHFGIEISDEDAAAIYTVSDFCHYVIAKLGAKHDKVTPSYQAVFEEIRNELIRTYKVKPDLITDEAQFVKDLGLD